MDELVPDANATPYSAEFYGATTEGSLLAARAVLPHIWRLRAFSSVIDVGCGVGTWLAVARELGATSVRGLDGPYVPENSRLIGSAEFSAVDLQSPIECGGSFDLCLCLEVAEHLSPARGEGLVRDLTRLSSIIAFSAAIPFQGGDGHVNEMWPEYWASLFATHGYHVWDGLRDQIWDRRDVKWWYRQNLLLFVAASAWDVLLPGKQPSAADQLTRVHPESYLWNIRRRLPLKLRTTAVLDVDVYYAVKAGEMISPPGYGPEFPAPRPDFKLQNE